jgi:nicotinamide-nucleotide amidase
MAASGVEVVAIGDELILGDTIETNGAWLGRRLSEEGILVRQRTVTGDDDDAIRAAVSDALARTGFVICCGGLGPTPDDRTRTVVAALYGWLLEIDEAWLATIRARFVARGLRMPDVNRVQAEVPRGAVLLTNDLGTAPGLLLHDDARGTTILLPGVPSELRWLVEQHVLPYLRRRMMGGQPPVRRRVLRTTGIAESALAERVDDIARSIGPLGLAFLPTGTGIDLRLTSWGDLPDDQAREALDHAEARLRERLGPIVYGAANDDLATLVGAALRERRLTIAVAESCTGGLLAKRLTDAAGASDYLIAGVVTYANDAKMRLLGVDEAILASHGAVSEAAASAMLDGVIRITNADCALSITGVAGPGGGSEEKPVGTVWVGAALPGHRTTRLLRLFGSRAEIRERSAQGALKILLDLLREEKP